MICKLAGIVGAYEGISLATQQNPNVALQPCQRMTVLKCTHKGHAYGSFPLDCNMLC